MAISRRKFVACVAIAGLSIVATGSMAGCGGAAMPSSSSGTGADGDDIITISMSEQGESERERLTQADYAAYFNEENYPKVLEGITDKDQNTFPEVDTAMPLSHAEVGGYSVYKLENDDATCTLFYIHGGAYAFGINASHVQMCEKMANRLNAQVFMPLYPLVPRGNCLEAYAFLDAAYEQALAAGKPIYLMGDSAGGGLSCAFAEHLRDTGTELPKGLVLFSPWLDVTMSNPDIASYEDEDIQLKSYGLIELGKLWANSLDVKDSRVSPIFGDVNGLPPTLLITGTKEIFYPDITEFHQTLKSAGIKTQLVCGEGLWHVYAAWDMPESDSTFDIVETFCKGI